MLDGNYRLHLDEHNLIPQLAADLQDAKKQPSYYFQLHRGQGVGKKNLGYILSMGSCLTKAQKETPVNVFIAPRKDGDRFIKVEWWGRKVAWTRLEIPCIFYLHHLDVDGYSKGGLYFNAKYVTEQQITELFLPIVLDKFTISAVPDGRKAYKITENFLGTDLQWPPKPISKEQYATDMAELFGDKGSSILLKEMYK